MSGQRKRHAERCGESQANRAFFIPGIASDAVIMETVARHPRSMPSCHEGLRGLAHIRATDKGRHRAGQGFEARRAGDGASEEVNQVPASVFNNTRSANESQPP